MTDRSRSVLKMLLTDAISARLAYDQTLRAIEEALGGDCGELDSFVDAIAGTTNGDDDEAIDMLLDLKVEPVDPEEDE